MAFGREMFESTSDVSTSPPHEIAARDAKEYALPGGETDLDRPDRDGRPAASLERREELLEAIGEVRERNGYALAALMVTDILEQSHRPARLRRRRPPSSAPSASATATASSTCPA